MALKIRAISTPQRVPAYRFGAHVDAMILGDALVQYERYSSVRISDHVDAEDAEEEHRKKHFGTSTRYRVVPQNKILNFA